MPNSKRFDDWGFTYAHEDMLLPEEYDAFLLGGTISTICMAGSVPVYSMDGLAAYIKERDELDSLDDAVDQVISEFGSSFMGHTTPVFVELKEKQEG